MEAFSFEVFGKVQGVFFRKYTQKHATSLGLFGWVKNTTKCTVVGVAQGHPVAIKEMKTWLSKKGSPKSKIDKCTIKTIPLSPNLKEFIIIRD